MPESRYRHTAHVSQNQLLILGGLNQKKIFGTIHSFSNQRWSIVKIDNLNIFAGRYFHSSATSQNGDVYIFGGSTGDNIKLNDVLILSGDDKFKRLPVFDEDSKPCARDFHAAAIVDNIMYIIGGSDKKGEKLCDIYSFKLPITQQQHSMTVITNSEQLIVQDMLKLVDLANEEHSASDLELFIQDRNEQ